MSGENNGQTNVADEDIQYVRQLAARAAKAVGRSEFSIWIQFIFDLARTIECGRQPGVSAEASVYQMHGVSATDRDGGREEELATATRTRPLAKRRRVPPRRPVPFRFWPEAVESMVVANGGVMEGKDNGALARKLHERMVGTNWAADREARGEETYKPCYDAVKRFQSNDRVRRIGNRLELISDSPDRKPPTTAAA